MGTLLIPKTGWSLLDTKPDDHFFLNIYMQGGADCSYMFDARPLAMTAAGKIQNYLGKDPSPYTGANGTTCFAMSLVDPLRAYDSYFSVINGVFMSSFDGHPQNTNALFTGNPFGGDSFLPYLNLPETGTPPASVDGIQNGYVIFLTSTNTGRMVPLDPQSTSPLAAQLGSIPALASDSELGAHLRRRLTANASSSACFRMGRVKCSPHSIHPLI